MPLIPVLGRQEQADLCEFKACLLYTVSARTARATKRNLVSTALFTPLPHTKKDVRAYILKMKAESRQCKLEMVQIINLSKLT